MVYTERIIEIEGWHEGEVFEIWHKYRAHPCKAGVDWPKDQTDKIEGM
jgi:hypothetical protein